MTRAYPPPTVPERYAQALGREDPIETLRKGPKRIRKRIKGLTKKELRRRPGEGKWSVHEVLAHLTDDETMIGARIRFIAGMDRPPIASWDQDAFMLNLPHDRATTRELWKGFVQLRAINVSLLDRLPNEAFARVGLHSERGEESLSSLVHIHAGHSRVHEAQIARTCEAVRARRRRKKVRRRS